MSDKPLNEATIQAKIRLTIAKHATVFRNNVGATKTDDGRYIQYGVCNPGGSDLIGWKSLVITPEMVGQKFAQFVAIECKSAKGKVSEDQKRFLNAVKNAGGIAGVSRSEVEALALVGVSIEHKKT